MNNSIINEIKYNFKTGNNVFRFIAINVFIFVVLGLFSLFDSLFKLGGLLKFNELFAFPSTINSWIQKPWSILTYMFIHGGLFHLLGNMIMLYFGGRIFTDLLGNKRVVPLYFAGGLFGALLFMLLYNIVPLFSESGFHAQLIGSSAAVLAIFFAIAAYVPNYEVFLIILGPVRLKYIALFLFVLDLLSIDQGNPGGHIAHIGGALVGISYAYGLKKGYDFTLFFNRNLDKIATLFLKIRQPQKSKIKVAYKHKGSVQPKAPNPASKQEIIDAILDKISKSGYSSLTKEEQEIIFRLSKED